MKAFARFAVVAAFIVTCAPSFAQFANTKPEDAIKYRQSALFVIGQQFGRIGAMVNGRIPFDAKGAAESAEIVATMSALPWSGFIPGTDKGGNTKAKGEVWTEQAKFKESSDKFVNESTKLAAAAKTGNLDTLKVSFAATADTCKSCHDAFRNK